MLEEKPAQARHDQGRRKAPDERDAGEGQQRRRVGPDGEEGHMAEIEEPRVADLDVQAQREDGVDGDDDAEMQEQIHQSLLSPAMT